MIPKREPPKPKINLKKISTNPIVLAVLLLLIGIIANKYVSRKETNLDIRSKALDEAVVFMLNPITPEMPPEKTLSLTANTKDHTIGFVMVSFSFDPKKIALSSEITVNPAFQTIIHKSTPEEANATGVVSVALALVDPENQTAPPVAPTGTFEIARMAFKPISENPDDTAELVMLTDETQIVDAENGNTELSYLTTRVNFTLNKSEPTAIPTEAVTDTVAPPTETQAAPTEAMKETPTDGDSSKSGTIDTAPSLTPTETTTLAPTSTPTKVPSTPTPTPDLIIHDTTPTPTPTQSATATSTPTGVATPTPTRRYRRPTPTLTSTPKPTVTPKPTINITLTNTPTPVASSSAQNINDLILRIPISGDVNGDGCVDNKDIGLFIIEYRNNAINSVYDVNRDGNINFIDMFTILQFMGKGCAKQNHPWWWSFFLK
jgi:hypothetical protein